MSTNFLEEVFSSRIRVRVVRKLIQYKEINITKLTKDLGLNHRIIEQHINALKNLGIVEEKRFGRIRIIRLVENDVRVMAIERLFLEIEGKGNNDSLNRD
ncbi:MAG: ArsR family transcriptional regulator [Vulcanisaeta sp. AZ3]|jgi:DNA-binding transcriptional ArsR family regulator|nr:MAG: hypothetical protein TU36_06380 [Vulcanisaeta sp. AZ3]